MNIVIEFTNPGTYSYSVFKIYNYKGHKGLSYVLGAGFTDNFAPDPMNNLSNRIHYGNLERINLTTTRFPGLSISGIYNSVRKELEIIEGINKTSKFEDLSDGESILEKAATSHQWGQTVTPGHGISFTDTTTSVKESAIPNTLFKVSKKTSIKKSRKVIPMKSNLKFKK